MALDLDKMSEAELKQLQKDVEKALVTFETRKKAEARKALEALAEEHGFSLKDLVDGKASKGGSGKGKGVPKYANPADPSQTWTGKGRQPVWYKEAIEAGADPSSLEI
jgi:DNA-binding protein H-NS